MPVSVLLRAYAFPIDLNTVLNMPVVYHFNTGSPCGGRPSRNRANEDQESKELKLCHAMYAHPF